VLRHLDRFGLDLQDWLAARAGTMVSARAQYADSIERQRLELGTVEQRIGRAHALVDRALDADDQEGADAAMRAVARTEAAQDKLAAEIAAAERQLADWPEEPDQASALAAYRAINDYVQARIDHAMGSRT
jgi:septal ring factor EnvC (AmiA/AmiB activator)